MLLPLRKLIILFCFFLPFTIQEVIAQITTQEYPPSFYEQKLSKTKSIIDHLITPPDISTLQKEDKVEAADKSIPWRFGTAIPTQIDLKKDWKITDQGNGYFLCNVSISIKYARSLNLNFNDFYLSPNAKLFIYDIAYNDIIGALTKSNNKADRKFSSRPIFSDQVRLELIVPKSEFDQNKIFIHQIVYGYRDLQEKIQKVFQSSRNCNININCSQGDDWQEIKRSVAMITTSNNTRFCTGVLVNNVRQDSTPYLLTGAHCNVATNSVFIFGYESEKCSPNTDGILTNSISGASTRAVSIGTFTDFELMELSSKPPKSYGVHYAGWSAFNTPAQNSTVIHHPSGDVKKISIDEDSTITGGYYNSNGTTHWTVNGWEEGSTEGGSSGAPLFDQNQRIIGLLHGGDAACGNSAQDYFGKIAVSWNTKTDSSRQLRFWLDPDTTGTLALDGLSTDSAEFDHDLNLVNVGGVQQFFCDSLVTPSISVKNIGNDTISSINFKYNLDGGIDSTYTFVKTLLRNELVTISLPSLISSGGTQELNVTASIGGSVIDQNTANNSKSYQFVSAAAASSTIEVVLQTDNFGEETSWAISDAQSNIKLHTRGPFISVPGGLLYRRNFCIPDTACFYTDLFDSEGDGFNGSFGNGFFLIKDQKGDTLVFEDDFTTANKRDTFCLNTQIKSSLRENTKELSLPNIFPNPVVRGQHLNIDSSLEENQSYTLFDAMGRVILTSTASRFLIPTTIAEGLYYLRAESKEGNISKSQKVLIQ